MQIKNLVEYYKSESLVGHQPLLSVKQGYLQLLVGEIELVESRLAIYKIRFSAKDAHHQSEVRRNMHTAIEILNEHICSINKLIDYVETLEKAEEYIEEMHTYNETVASIDCSTFHGQTQPPFGEIIDFQNTRPIILIFYRKVEEFIIELREKLTPRPQTPPEIEIITID